LKHLLTDPFSFLSRSGERHVQSISEVIQQGQQVLDDARERNVTVSGEIVKQEGTPITAELLTSLTEGERRRKGWPVHSVLEGFMKCDAIGWVGTVEQVMAMYPANEYPGYYLRDVCPNCHGSGMCGKDGLCGGAGSVCPRCRNMGYMFSPGLNKLIECNRCEILLRQRKEKMEAHWQGSCGLTDKETGYTFEAGLWNDQIYDGVAHIDKLREAAGFMRYWATHPGADDIYWIVMVGLSAKSNVGVGKTYLGCSIVNESRGSGLPAYRWQTSQLIDLLREKAMSDQASYLERSLEIQKWPGVLILDEFEKARETPFATEVINTLLTYRERAWLPTVIIGNVTMAEVRATMPWLASRLYEKEVWLVDLEGLPDWRVAMHGWRNPKMPEEL
jgi:hypothetical protein